MEADGIIIGVNNLVNERSFVPMILDRRSLGNHFAFDFHEFTTVVHIFDYPNLTGRDSP